MPFLIAEILYDIAKELVESGNQEDVYKFAVSGKEPLKAMKNVFATASGVSFYVGLYHLISGGKCSILKFSNEKPHSNFLMNQIGNSVKTLHIEFMDPVYQPIIDKIIARKQLISFSANCACDTSFLDQFLPQFSSTLKDVYISTDRMTGIFRDTLNLDSLVLDPISLNSFLFCCKTKSLELCCGGFAAFSQFATLFPESHKINPNLSSIQVLTFNEFQLSLSIDSCNELMKHFPSLRFLKFNFDFDPNEIVPLIECMFELIEISTNVPSQIKCSFFKTDPNFIFPDLEQCKEICNGFEYIDKPSSDFYYFVTVFDSAGSQSTIIEIEISK